MGVIETGGENIIERRILEKKQRLATVTTRALSSVSICSFISFFLLLKGNCICNGMGFSIIQKKETAASYNLLLNPRDYNLVS